MMYYHIVLYVYVKYTFLQYIVIILSRIIFYVAMCTNCCFCLKSCLGVSEVRGIVNSKCVRDGYQTVQAALLDYTLTCYPTIQVII